MEQHGYLKMQEFGEGVMLYTLSNKVGGEVELLNYGATIRALRVPDHAGHPVDVVLGFNTLAEYKACTAYIGCTVGRTAGRVRGGCFTLDGKKVELSKNEKGTTTLHGGHEGFNRKLWAVSIDPSNPHSLTMEHVSKDGDEGYPGTVHVRVVFTLAEAINELTITYEATTDQPTPVSLTNHSYFNLNGEDSSHNALNNLVMLASSKYLPVDKELLPTGAREDVAGTPMDFRTPTEIGKRIKDSGFEQFKITRGYDHPWLLDLPDTVKCSAFSPLSKIEMTIKSDQPSVVMYTGNYLDGKMVGKRHTPYTQHHGFCLETQSVENSMNDPSFPSCILLPGQKYHQVTSFHFATK
jgi:aldose 1-epimerase